MNHCSVWHCRPARVSRFHLGFSTRTLLNILYVSFSRQDADCVTASTDNYKGSLTYVNYTYRIRFQTHNVWFHLLSSSVIIQFNKCDKSLEIKKETCFKVSYYSAQRSNKCLREAIYYCGKMSSVYCERFTESRKIYFHGSQMIEVGYVLSNITLCLIEWIFSLKLSNKALYSSN